MLELHELREPLGKRYEGAPRTCKAPSGQPQIRGYKLEAVIFPSSVNCYFLTGQLTRQLTWSRKPQSVVSNDSSHCEAKESELHVASLIASPSTYASDDVQLMLSGWP
jgi:hypothetical protein